MRNEARTAHNVQQARISGYHGGDYNTHKIFASDRPIVVDRFYRRPDGQPLQHYGIELETECNGVLSQKGYATIWNQIIFKRFPADLWKLEQDGSLGGRVSAEVISQPMTKAFIRNHYRDFKAMYDDDFDSFNIKTDSAVTACGMHVNVSNALFGKTQAEQAEAIRKLYYIVNRHYDVMKKAFYRAGSTRWCGQMNYSNAREMDIFGGYHANNHGACMNLSHIAQGRVEIRLVGGQRDYYCFRNTMETVFHIVERCRTISWADCDKIDKIFKGCNQYVMKRLRDCGLSDSTLEEIEQSVKPEDLEVRARRSA